MSNDTPHHPSDEDAKSPDLLSNEELLQKLDDTEKKMNDYWERILRMQAESENLKRRSEKELSNAHKFALEKFVSELIPIVDSLELCITNTKNGGADSVQAILEGVELTHKMFMTSLEKFGVKQVNPLNQPFDSHYEQAISTQVDTSVAAGTVLSVLQKGYTLNERLIRPALVVVSKSE